MSKKKNNGAAEASGGKQEKGKEGGGNKTVVLTVSMHCDDCADKVIKSVKGFTGVEAAKADVESNELRLVVGKDVDPWKLRDRLAAKMHKKVGLVSPTEKQPPVKQAKPDDKKSSTVVLKISLYCHGCISKIRKTIWGIKGVEHVAVDAERDEVTVKGTMDAKALPRILKEKLNRAVEVVQPEKDNGVVDGGKKNKMKGDGGQGKQQLEKNMVATAVAGNIRMMDVYSDYRLGMMPQYAPAPQIFSDEIFSDENPNAACAIM